MLDDATRIQAMGNLAGILAGVKRTDEARALLERFVHEARRSGLVALETIGLADLGEYKLVAHDYESARAAYAAVLTQLRSSANKYYEMESLRGFGLASLGLGQRVEARAAFSEMLELALAATGSHSSYLADALSCIALAAEPEDADRAARLRGAVAQLNSDAGVVMNAYADDAELEGRGGGGVPASGPTRGRPGRGGGVGGRARRDLPSRGGGGWDGGGGGSRDDRVSAVRQALR